MEPAGLLRLAVEIGVDVAVHLKAVLEVAPLVHGVVAVGVDKLPQNGPRGGLDDPTDLAVELSGSDRTLGRVVGRGLVVVDPLLDGGEFECLRGGRPGGQDDPDAEQKGDTTDGHLQTKGRFHRVSPPMSAIRYGRLAGRDSAHYLLFRPGRSLDINRLCRICRL